MRRCHVVIAPDSFKGSLPANAAAAALAIGWRRVRPGDVVRAYPQADGGEGTLEALASTDPQARWQEAGQVTGPDGRPVRGRWLRLGDGVAAAELAAVAGLPLMRRPDALGAGTHGLGEVVRAAAGARIAGGSPLFVGLGGSASTDGGAGLLTALGARLLDRVGRPLPAGGGALRCLARLDLAGLIRPQGMVVLLDVTAPLLGPFGAAAVFGPQKGAEPTAVAALEEGLRRWADVIGVDPQQPGMGAAGGTAYALVAVLGARVEPGAPWVARATGLTEAARTANVLISGEGRFDATSAQGKTVGHALRLPGPTRRIVIAGSVEATSGDVETWSLTDLAGSPEAALADPAHWLTEAGARAAAAHAE